MQMTESSGLATPPCGVPHVLLLPPLMCRFPSPSRSSIGAFSHSLISRNTWRSTMRRATDLRRSECGIVSKYFDKSASTTSVYVYKNVRSAAVGRNETEALRCVEPFHCSGRETPIFDASTTRKPVSEISARLRLLVHLILQAFRIEVGQLGKDVANDLQRFHQIEDLIVQL